MDKSTGSSGEIPLLQAIKSAAIEASLITTFNATLPFYEDVVLRRLVAAGSKYNIVLMDHAQCARAWETPSMRPRLAGAAYALVPMAAPGAFHPKIGILAGKKRSVLFVGSHNLTLSGFGFNREVTNWMQIDNTADLGRRLALAHAWSLICEWVSRQDDALPGALVDAIHRFGEFLPAEPRDADGDYQIRLLGQSRDGPPLLQQLQTAFPATPQRAVVLGAFFDREHLFLRALEALWPKATIRVVIDPETVKMGRRPRKLRSQFVNARLLWNECEGQYLHAKALLLDFGGSWALATGSANPSRPAWLAGERANFEAMLLSQFTMGEAPRFARDLGQAWTSPVMSEAELEKISPTALDGESEEVSNTYPVVVAVPQRENGTITLPANVSKGLNRANVFGYDDFALTSIEPRQSANGELVIELGEYLQHARWIELTGSGHRVLRVIVHHEHAVQSMSGKSRRSELRDALAGLEMCGANLESLLSIIHHAVFDDDVEIADPASKTAAKRNGERNLDRPGSLGVHVGNAAVHKKKRRILRDGSILEIVNALIHRIGTGVATGHADSPRRNQKSEEEGIGGEEVPPEAMVGTPLTDQTIALAIEKKLGLLISRMCRQLNVSDPLSTSTQCDSERGA